MRVYLGSDHGGYELKQAIVDHLREGGHEPVDCGAYAYDAEDDYPAFCIAAALKTVADPGSLGIVLGGSGNGEQIAANKVPGARCALGWSPETASLARRHNNALLIGIGPATSAAARGVVEGVLFADRMIIESCIGAQQRTLYVSGAFGYEPELPQLLADALDRDILVVDESHLPAIGAAAMCVEVLEGNVVLPPDARLVRPRPEWRSIVAERWQHYRQVWSTVTGTLPLSTLDETIESVAPAVSEPKPKGLTRSVLT